MKKDIVSMLPEELEQDFALLDEQKFRAKQVFQWLGRGVRDFDKMTNLSKPLREKLKGEYELYEPKVIGKQVSAIDGTIKYLWELKDGNAVETVVMSYKHGNTVCVSSQVGCRQGCAFCASTIGGLVRNLEPSEILDEVLFSQLDSGKTISNIVLMGIGEPLDNFDNVMRFLELVNRPDGANIGMRHISLSTCGLIERFDDLAERDMQHIAEDHFLWEVVDPATGEPVPEGEMGELVLTPLDKEGIPVLRYRTHDLTRVVTEKCSCGRTHARMQKVRSRCDDMLIIRGTNVFPSQVEDVLAGIEGVTPHYLIVVDNETGLDRMTVNVELKPEAFSDSFEVMDNFRQMVADKLKGTLLVGVKVKLVEPGGIERSVGKTKHVRDLRK